MTTEEDLGSTLEKELLKYEGEDLKLELAAAAPHDEEIKTLETALKIEKRRREIALSKVANKKPRTEDWHSGMNMLIKIRKIFKEIAEVRPEKEFVLSLVTRDEENHSEADGVVVALAAELKVKLTAKKAFLQVGTDDAVHWDCSDYNGTWSFEDFRVETDDDKKEEEEEDKKPYVREWTVESFDPEDLVTEFEGQFECEPNGHKSHGGYAVHRMDVCHGVYTGSNSVAFLRDVL